MGVQPMPSSKYTIEHILRQTARKVQPYSNGFLITALHREDRHPSVSVFLAGDTWFVKDHATGESWSLKRYLREFAGVDLEDDREWARPKPEFTKKKVSVPKPAEDPAPIDEEARKRVEAAWEEALARLGDGPTAYLRSRGFEPELAADLGLGVDADGNIVIPTFTLVDGEWRTTNLQIRKKDGEPRYTFAFSGHGSGYYVVGNTEEPTMVHIVEGPLNAASLAALRNTELECFIGVPGASHNLTRSLVEWLAKGRFPIALWSDADPAGRKARAKWLDTLVFHGVDMSRIIVPTEDNLHRDINDIFRSKGGSYIIGKLLSGAKPPSKVKGARHLGLAKLDKARTTRELGQMVGHSQWAFARMTRAVGGFTLSQAINDAVKLIARVARKHGYEIKPNEIEFLFMKSRPVRHLVNLVAGTMIDDEEISGRVIATARKGLTRALEMSLADYVSVGRGYKVLKLDLEALVKLVASVAFKQGVGEWLQATKKKLNETFATERAAFYAMMGGFVASLAYLIRGGPPGNLAVA